MLLFRVGNRSWGNMLNRNEPPASLFESYVCFNLHLTVSLGFTYCIWTVNTKATYTDNSEYQDIHIKPPILSISISPLYCFSYVARPINTPLPLPSISMVAERTCRSIWLIIFTLPAEAGLSWGCLHLSHLSFFVQFNSSSYYPSNHLFLFLHMYPSGSAHAAHTQLARVASRHSVWGGLSAREKKTQFLQKRARKKAGSKKKSDPL